MGDAVDRDLWSKAHDDPEAFGEIFARHAKPVYNYLFRRCGDWSAAEDLTSIVFLEAWRRRADVRLVHDSALPFLFGVATNVLRNRRRSERRYREALTRMPALSDATDPADDPAARAAAEQDMRAILAVLGSSSPTGAGRGLPLPLDGPELRRSRRRLGRPGGHRPLEALPGPGSSPGTPGGLRT